MDIDKKIEDGLFSEVLSEIEISLADESAEQGLLYRGVVCYYHLKKYKECISLIHRVLDAPASEYQTNAALLLGYACKDLNEWKNAIQAFRDFLSKHPDHPKKNLVWMIVALCHEELEEYTDANEIYNRILTDVPDEELQSEALFRKAVCAENNTEFSQARKHYEKLLEAKPENPEGLRFRIAVCLFRQNLYDRALTVLEDILSSEDSTFLSSLADELKRVCILRKTETEKSIRAYNMGH